MTRPALTLAQLAVLDAIARHGGVGAAARELGLSQPSVSNHLAALEERLRQRLFRRSGHVFTPTEPLASLLPRIHAALSLAREVEEVLAGVSSLRSGRLRLGYSTHQFVMEALARFLEGHPGVRIEARSLGSHDLLAALHRGDLDAAFVTLAEPPAGLAALELRREPIVLMAPRGSALDGAGPLSWARIGALGLIRREPASGTRRVFDAAAEAAGVRLRTALDLGSWESMRAAVAQGVGVGVAMAGEIEPSDPSIVAVPIAPPAPEVGHHLVALPELRRTAQVAALFEETEALSIGRLRPR